MVQTNSITWPQIYSKWKENEKGIWENTFLSQGFSSWEDWREKFIAPLKLEKMEWKLFEFEANEMKNFKCGAFKQWLEIAKEVNGRSFEKLAQAKIFQKFPKIEAIKQSFPTNNLFFGFKKGNQIILFEGNHRAIACTQMMNQEEKFPTMRIALAELDENNEYPYVDFVPEQ